MSFATADERFFVRLVNNTRKEMGLDPLKVAKPLNEAADGHTQWMLDTSTFSHTGEGGSRASKRIEEAGFPMVGESWGTRENLGYIGVTGAANLRDEIRQMHQNLLDSPSHRKNILDPDLEYIGIGLEVGRYDGHTVLMATQNFGRTTGQPEIDMGLFPKGHDLRPDLSVESRADWLADTFNGAVRSSSNNGSIVTGTTGADDFRLSGASDFARGLTGDDWMSGGAGRDTLEGGAGFDRLMGGTGDDLLRGGYGDDVLDGQGGDDRLEGAHGADLLRGGYGHDELAGHGGHDTLVGGGGDDQMTGGYGFDFLLGGGGNDELRGSAGRDTLEGGQGNDLLIGGSGPDTFMFRKGLGDDRISDYEAGIDRLLIDDALLGRSVPKFYDDIVRETDSGVVLDFGNGNRITIEGQGLTAEAVADDIVLF
ncbi:CAP domain-containing protein [Paracoccus aerius]|uniref:SCP domain-containing protein n=1 Tax=Paracoccus aerius TaxID=1915382 RepID=A0ABS1S9V7_9RHOB|nr:CAP domain-containing protein [Paracoccus aerius]MBL3675513.1 hypothetical protein [Paracoccus aerius]GHG35055.1 hypothetical protein GCM10017322_37430 [Paracoccus aerius]